MEVSQADRVFRAVLVLEGVRDWWGYDELSDVLEDSHGEDAPSRRTVQNRLHGLEKLGVIRGRDVGQSRLYRLNTELLG